MKQFFAITFLLSFILCLFSDSTMAENKFDSIDMPKAYVIEVNDIITPATSDFIRRHLIQAQNKKTDIIVLELDTPGGLMKSTKEIIQDILKSPIPVATYVTPSGAHAASAGTYIMYASHIAAMTPATNLGAATPISLTNQKDQSIIQSKATNDSAAYIRGLAKLRHRNIEWAEKAVRESISLSAHEALKEKVINFVANNTETLLKKAHGRSVQVGDKKTTLRTKGAVITRHKPDLRAKILSIIADPNITFILMTLGAYGLIYEFANPGAFFPGIVGGVFLILGMFALNILPINYTGALLMFLGIACMTGEAFVPSFGILGIGGSIAFALGGTILIDSNLAGFGISPWLIGSMTFTSLAILSFALAVALRARKNPITTGNEAMLQETGEIVKWSRRKGEVLVSGSVWRAKSLSMYILKKGDKVKINEIDGLCLIIEPAKIKE